MPKVEKFYNARRGRVVALNAAVTEISSDSLDFDGVDTFFVFLKCKKCKLNFFDAWAAVFEAANGNEFVKVETKAKAKAKK